MMTDINSLSHFRC